jgi:hypothetical protein
MLKTLTKLFNQGGKYVLLSLALLSILPAQGQTESLVKKPKKRKTFLIEAQYGAGKVAPVYPNFPKNTFVNIAEVHVGYQTAGESQWNKIFNYPRLGVSFIYQNLGNNAVFGQQFSIVPTVYFSTAKKENAKVFADFRVGMGLATFNKVYDTITNPSNDMVSEHATWQITLGSNLHWNISEYLSLQVGAMWYHASDSHTVLPNVGINTFGGFAGLAVYPFGRAARSHTYDTLQVENKWHANFRFGSGYQAKGGPFGPEVGPKYPVYTAAAYASKRVAKVFLLKAGAIYRYYPLYQSVIEGNPAFTSNTKLKSSAFIVFGGSEFLLGHFAISVEVGINVYKPAYKTFSDEYLGRVTPYNYYLGRYLATRFGANYYILDPYKHMRNNVFVGAYVSANSGEAEFLELNVGYVF